MQIYVCVKHVPDTAANIKVVPPAAFDESVKFVANPYDEYGLEEALKITAKEGGEVIAVTVGKESAVSSLRTALAVGAARGILVKTDAQFLDSGVTQGGCVQRIENLKLKTIKAGKAVVGPHPKVAILRLLNGRHRTVRQPGFRVPDIDQEGRVGPDSKRQHKPQRNQRQPLRGPPSLETSETKWGG